MMHLVRAAERDRSKDAAEASGALSRLFSCMGGNLFASFRLDQENVFSLL